MLKPHLHALVATPIHLHNTSSKPKQEAPRISDTEHKFQQIKEGEEIQTQPFLLACSQIIPFFDVLGPTAFKPVKSDINGNIQATFATEIAEGTSKGSYSCTVGLLWLKRALEFVYVFLETVLSGEQDLVKCANKAYEASLKRYHGWLVKGIFAVAVRAVPYYQDFMVALKKDPSTSDSQVLEDMRTSITLLKANIDEINRFYTQKGQHSEDTV
ncbi:hypothetical protein EMCRGX_G024683 [Ephydatia muelleri]